MKLKDLFTLVHLYNYFFGLLHNNIVLLFKIFYLKMYLRLSLICVFLSVQFHGSQ